MSLPDDRELIRYSLGQPVSHETRLKIARSKKLQARIVELERQLLHEGLEFQGQAGGFDVTKNSSY